jgi:hypothetical protein
MVSQSHIYLWNTCATLSWSNRSSIQESGYLFFTVTLFNCLWSMQNMKVPSFFLTNNTGAPQVELLGIMNTLSSNSYNCTFNSTNSTSDILYRAWDIGIVPGNTFIENSISHLICNPGNSLGNTSYYRCRMWWKAKRRLGLLRSCHLVVWFKVARKTRVY